MFWDKYAKFYDLFENSFNGKVYRGFSSRTAEMLEAKDDVLEAACGTGVITVKAAERCRTLIATDLSEGMLDMARKKCAGCPNVFFEKGDILDLKYEDGRFDKVIAGNVIHIVPDPRKAMSEMLRVSKPGGKIILPVFLSKKKGDLTDFSIRVLKLIGADFRETFSFESYKAFIADLGFPDAEFELIDGAVPNAIAVITKKA